MMNRPRILILGDAMVDTYLETAPVGISDEAPVAVLDWIGVKQRSLGGMLNVAASLTAVGCEVEAVGLHGEDDAGAFVREECEQSGIRLHALSDGRPTTEKVRITAGQDYLARLDTEQIEPIGDALTDAAIERVAAILPGCAAVIVSDYVKGFVTQRLASAVLETARAYHVPILVDAKPGAMRWLRGASLFTPNEREAREFARLAGAWASNPFERNKHKSTSHGLEAHAPVPEDLNAVVAVLSHELSAPILITRGAGGLTLFDSTGALLVHCDAEADRIDSTSGAGDVILAVMAWCVAQGVDRPTAARHAAAAAARAVSRAGTCRLQLGDLRDMEHSWES